MDTNVLLRLVQIGHPHQQPALDAITTLRTRDNESFVSCPQRLYEMYVVCTRPAQGPNPGLGLPPAAAMAQVDAAQRQFPAEPEPAGTLGRWKDLVVRYGVTGKSSHDARLVALMIERDIPRLLTFNDSDFTRYTGIVALNPFDVLGAPRA